LAFCPFLPKKFMLIEDTIGSLKEKTSEEKYPGECLDWLENLAVETFERESFLYSNVSNIELVPQLLHQSNNQQLDVSDIYSTNSTPVCLLTGRQSCFANVFVNSLPIMPKFKNDTYNPAPLHDYELVDLGKQSNGSRIFNSTAKMFFSADGLRGDGVFCFHGNGCHILQFPFIKEFFDFLASPEQQKVKLDHTFVLPILSDLDNPPFLGFFSLREFSSDISIFALNQDHQVLGFDLGLKTDEILKSLNVLLFQEEAEKQISEFDRWMARMEKIQNIALPAKTPQEQLDYLERHVLVPVEEVHQFISKKIRSQTKKQEELVQMYEESCWKLETALKEQESLKPKLAKRLKQEELLLKKLELLSQMMQDIFFSDVTQEERNYFFKLGTLKNDFEILQAQKEETIQRLETEIIDRKAKYHYLSKQAELNEFRYLQLYKQLDEMQQILTKNKEHLALLESLQR